MNKKLSFSVDLDSPIAVYVQIENQVMFAVASGCLKPGDTLPSVREMSTVLHVNPNTVTKAYRDLELMQLVRTRRGVGVTIAENAPRLCRSKVRVMVEAHLRDSVSECVASGFTGPEIRKIVSNTLDSGRLPYQK